MFSKVIYTGNDQKDLVALEDSDKQEELNLQAEESMSMKMYAKLTELRQESKELCKEFKHLLKTGKKLRTIIRNKESENRQELLNIERMQERLPQESVKQIRLTTSKLKNKEKKESALSKEEATILQNMLNELHDTYKHGQDILAADLELYTLIKELYEKDLEDYQLEVQDIKSE